MIYEKIPAKPEIFRRSPLKNTFDLKNSLMLTLRFNELFGSCFFFFYLFPHTIYQFQVTAFIRNLMAEAKIFRLKGLKYVSANDVTPRTGGLV